MRRLVRPLGLAVMLLVAFVAGRADAQPYPNAKTGGNYMHNFYFAPAAKLLHFSPFPIKARRQNAHNGH